MSRLDGRTLRTAHALEADVVVVGSGPAGAAVARALAGLEVLVIEAGDWLDDPPPSTGFLAMSRHYRDMGSSVVLGSALVPYVQGRAVGGSSPVNGAICWRLPQDVWRAWIDADPGLEQGLPWPELEAATDLIEARLGVAPTDPAIAGPKNLRMARGAEALGLAHRPIRRNVQGCRGSGRCLQGCPHGAKQSVDRTLLSDAMDQGTTVVSAAEVQRVLVERGRAVGVLARAAGGASLRARARVAVVLAASAIQTPVLLLRSGLGQGPVGEGFQGHPGVSMSGRFAEPVHPARGATQGHEVTGLRGEGLKFEALGFGEDLLATRLPGVGRTLAGHIAEREHWLCWGAAVRASARGRVRSVLGRPVVSWSATAGDIALYRRGLRVLGELMFAAGAQWVSPGVQGFSSRVEHPRELVALEREGPRRASAYTAAITHMFGTCRAGSDPARSVVRPDLRHHQVAGLYVADSSVFPTNLGVNPQVPIAAVATLCARHILESP